MHRASEEAGPRDGNGLTSALSLAPIGEGAAASKEGTGLKEACGRVPWTCVLTSGRGRQDGTELREADLCIWWVPRTGWVVQGQQASFLPREFLIGGP